MLLADSILTFRSPSEIRASVVSIGFGLRRIHCLTGKFSSILLSHQEQVCLAWRNARIFRMPSLPLHTGQKVCQKFPNHPPLWPYPWQCYVTP